MGVCVNGIKCAVVEWVTRNTLRWSGHMERMKTEEFVKIYLSEPEGLNMRGGPYGRWKDRVLEAMVEEGRIEHIS